jgi:hypothetical protein
MYHKKYYITIATAQNTVDQSHMIHTLALVLFEIRKYFEHASNAETKISVKVTVMFQNSIRTI